VESRDDDALADDLRARVASTTLYRELGISVVRAARGEVELACAPSNVHLNL
jgi:hypothetical protein